MGARAQARREHLGLKRIELAIALGLSESRVWQMEKDGVDRLSLIKLWAETLDMSVAELAFGKGKK